MFKITIKTKPRFLGIVESRVLTISGFKTYKECQTAVEKLKVDKMVKEVKVDCCS